MWVSEVSYLTMRSARAELRCSSSNTTPYSMRSTVLHTVGRYESQKWWSVPDVIVRVQRCNLKKSGFGACRRNSPFAECWLAMVGARNRTAGHWVEFGPRIITTDHRPSIWPSNDEPSYCSVMPLGTAPDSATRPHETERGPVVGRPRLRLRDSSLGAYSVFSQRQLSVKLEGVFRLAALKMGRAFEPPCRPFSMLVGAARSTEMWKGHGDRRTALWSAQAHYRC